MKRAITVVAGCLGVAMTCMLNANNQRGAAAERGERFGTAVEFAASPHDAAVQAARDEKLVMVLHLSGHFEEPRFT